MYLLGNQICFPPVINADADGLLAIGGDLSEERLLLAYHNGIFPWYNDGEMIQWWCPDPRFVLYPAELRVSKSMRRIIQQQVFTFRFNTAFESVIENCRTVFREGQKGTWIQTEVAEAYTLLHRRGYAVSAEAWKNDKLVGGLYGIRIGNIFFGESMFSNESNASKFAFINYVEQLRKEGVLLIDCQVYTPHLESLGARMISRNLFCKILKEGIGTEKNTSF